MIKALDSQLDSRPFYFYVITLAKLFACTQASITKQYNLVLGTGQMVAMLCSWEDDHGLGRK